MVFTDPEPPTNDTLYGYSGMSAQFGIFSFMVSCAISSI